MAAPATRRYVLASTGLPQCSNTKLVAARPDAVHAALRRDPDGREALEIVRGLIERISVGPASEDTRFDIELVGAITAMIDLGLSIRPRPLSVARRRHRLALSWRQAGSIRGPEPVLLRDLRREKPGAGRIRRETGQGVADPGQNALLVARGCLDR